MRTLTALLTAVAASTIALAESFVVPIDPTQSTATVTLEVSGVSDSDMTPLSGAVAVILMTVDQPTEISLTDFMINADEDIDLFLDYGFFGSLTAQVTGFGIADATPGTVKGPVPIVGGGYTFANVSADAMGLVSYDASGLPCTLLQGAGQPCTDSQDAGQNNPQTVDQLAGQISVVGRTVTLSASFNVTTPLDPANPGLGTLTATGQVVGSVDVPCVGDLTGDSVTDFADFSALVAGWGTADADLTGDGTTDFADFSVLVGDWNCGL